MSHIVLKPDEYMLIERAGKWTFLIVALLKSGVRRFTELKRSLPGISQKVLANSLRELERNGFVSRTIFATIPPRVEYKLTVLGSELLAIVENVQDFVSRNRHNIERARQRFDEITTKAK